MRLYHITGLIIFCSTLAMAQNPDSVDRPSIQPILSEQPVLYDRSNIASELEGMEKPVLQAGKVEVTDDFIQTRFSRHEARKLTIPEVEIDDVKKYWSQLLKKAGDGKLRADGSRLTIDAVQIKDVSSEPFDVEVQMDSNPDAVMIWMALEKDSVALSSRDDPGLFSALEGFMRREGLELYRSKVQNDIKEEEKNLKRLNDELQDLIRDNERMHKKITDNNLKIEDTNRELETNRIERGNSIARVSERKDILLQARTSDDEKDAKKALKAAEREKEKLEKDRNKMYDSLVDYQKEIEENEQLITKNLNEQKEMLLSIRKQELLVEAYQDKLEAIK